MKNFTLCTFLLLLFPFGVFGQNQNVIVQPDCIIPFSFTAVSATITGTQQFKNTGVFCVNWTVSYSSTGFSALSLVVESAPGTVTTPGSWSTFATPTTGSNPNTTTTSAVTTWTLQYSPWMRVRLGSKTGSGTITGLLYGYKAGTARSSGGGGSSFYQTVADEGTALAQEPILNFIGAGVTCVDNAGATRTDCTIPGGGGSAYATIQNAGSSVAQQATLNFVSGVTCANNGGASRTDCTVTPGTANYQQSFTAQTSVVLTHNLNTTHTLTQCYDGSNVEVVPNTTTITSANVITITFLIAQTGFCNVNGSGGPSSLSYKYQYMVAAAAITSGTVVAATTFNSDQALAATGLNGPLSGFTSLGLAAYAAGGGQAVIVARIPSTWDGSAITFDADIAFVSGPGTATITPYSSCPAIASDVNTTTWHAGSSVPVSTAGSSGSPYAQLALTIPLTGCSTGSMIWIGIVRAGGDAFGGSIFFFGGNLGIKY